MLYTKFLKKERGCPFCKLGKSEIIKKNRSAIAILSRGPYIKDHLLVIPKRHVILVEELNSREQKDLWKLVSWSLKKLHKKHENVSVLHRDGNGRAAGKSIQHLHVNLIPDIVIGSIKVDTRNRDFMARSKYLEETKKFMVALK